MSPFLVRMVQYFIIHPNIRTIHVLMKYQIVSFLFLSLEVGLVQNIKNL